MKPSVLALRACVSCRHKACVRTTDSTFFTGPPLRPLSFSLDSAGQGELNRLTLQALVADPAVFPNGL